ncbi:MAG: PilZ domain-containing protein [Desulfamplus sp.]|nr:PilZ domain-containing protein [Desulfamplus sp.]
MERTGIKTAEIRKHLRVTPSKDVYAVFGMEKNIIGKLCDISMGGIACKHFTDSDNGYDYSSLDLFTLDNQFYMTKIPCSVVYSVNVDEESEMKDKMAVKSRRVGVKFARLSFLHRSQLKDFVENATRWN